MKPSSNNCVKSCSLLLEIHASNLYAHMHMDMAVGASDIQTVTERCKAALLSIVPKLNHNYCTTVIKDTSCPARMGSANVS